MDTIDLSKLSDEDLAILARYGDKEARSYLWAKIVPKVESVVDRFAQNSRWVRSIREDVVQGVLLKYPTFIDRYDPKKLRGTFAKWLHFTLCRVTQDVLRAQKDVLGIGIPQKQEYPLWNHLGTFDDATVAIEEGRENMRRKIEPDLSPEPRSFRHSPKILSAHHVHVKQYHGLGRF